LWIYFIPDYIMQEIRSSYRG